LVVVFCFFWYWGLNSGPRACWEGAVPLWAMPQALHTDLWCHFWWWLTFGQIMALRSLVCHTEQGDVGR
jgi:hypothetical protein